MGRFGRLIRALALAAACVTALAFAEGEKDMRMWIEDTPVSVTWEDNAAVRALRQAVQSGDVAVSMAMYGGFEQVGDLGMSLPADDVRLTSQPGDVVLYSGDQIVVFYGSNTWAYTRLGHIDDPAPDALGQLLSGGDVTLTLSIADPLIH